MGADCCGGKKPLPSVETEPSSTSDISTDGRVSNAGCCTPSNEKCNQDCLKSVAATLCAEGVGDHADGHNDCCSKGCSDKPETSACDAHLRMAFEQYQSFIDDMRCICRSMIERGFKSCCNPPDAGTRTREPGVATQKSASCKPEGKSCCASSEKPITIIEPGCCSADVSQPKGVTKAGGRSTSGGCCGDKKAPSNCQSPKKEPGNCCDDNKGTTTNCCGKKTEPQNIFAGKGPDGCCTSKQRLGCNAEKKDTTNSCCGDKSESDGCINKKKQCQLSSSQFDSITGDIEIEESGGEVIRIGVTGMTCNGCSDNLERNLTANGVRNIRINYLQGYADFTIDPTQDLDALLVKTQESTGFQISIMARNESLTVLTSGSQSSKDLSQIDLDGVEKVISLKKNVVCIHYNPTIIGARELFRKIEPLTVGLAPPQSDQQLSSGRKQFKSLLVKTIASFVLTIPILVLTWGETHVEKHTEAIISLVLATIVQLLAVHVFYKPAIRAIVRHGVLELDMLVVVAITAAFVYSVVAFGYLMSGAPLETGAFFETSSLLISLIMLGRLVASYARIRAVAAVSVRSLQVGTAVLVENDVDREIDSRLLQFGDIFKVSPHSRIPTDGTVVSGISEVDESMITGESLPIVKQPGASLIAGTTNGSGTLVARLTRLPGKNTITDIAKLVEDASNSKPRVQEIADRVASWFLPTVLTIAAVVFIIWTAVGVKVRNQTAGESVATAITYAIAVLAVSCPCGIGLAAPLVLVFANGIAARGGVIVKSAECMERSRNTTDVIFDKTGTLTESALDVITEEFFNDDVETARAITRALVNDSQHPVSVAIAKHLGADEKLHVSVTNVKNIPGSGIEGSLSGFMVRAGHASWTGSDTLPEIRRMLGDGLSILMVTQDSAPLVAYGLRTRLRHDAISTISKLRESGIQVHLVSGDHNKAVQAIAELVGIDRANVASQQKPQEKQAYVATLMAQPNRVVMFCGDGTNDAVAVAQADIGVQLSDTVSSEVTRSAADIVLLSGLSGIPFLIDVSYAAFKRIAFNFIWSAIYNVFAILLSAGAFVRVRIAPAYAGAGELVSILPIIVAALTMVLLKLRPA